MAEATAAGPVRHYGINTDLVSFATAELGGLMLTDSEATQYRQCVDELHRQAAGNDEHISRSAVESIIQQTMLRAIDPIGVAPEKDFSRRLTSALATMEQELREEPIEWEVHFPVDGLTRENLPYKFGKCTFYFGDDAFVSSLEGRLNIIFASGTSDNDSIRKIISGKTIVTTSVKAVDSEAAKVLARGRIRQTVDILSFYANLGGRSRSQIIFAEDSGPKLLNWFLFTGQKPQGWMPSEWIGPLVPFSFTAPHLDKTGFVKVSQILQDDNISEFHEKAISALQWAGRASVEPRNEEAFLLFAIALESLLMGRGDNSEITEKLALRGAHVIANSKSRLKVYKDIKDLYGIRSQIVHCGHVDVGEADLSLLRFFVRFALLRMLCQSPFDTMTSDSNLVDWYRSKLLDLPTS
jgi:hypothetical protein